MWLFHSKVNMNKSFFFLWKHILLYFSFFFSSPTALSGNGGSLKGFTHQLCLFILMPATFQGNTLIKCLEKIISQTRAHTLNVPLMRWRKRDWELGAKISSYTKYKTMAFIVWIDQRCAFKLFLYIFLYIAYSVAQLLSD